MFNMLKHLHNICKNVLVFYCARQHILQARICYRNSVCLQCLSVCPSVRHTGGSVKTVEVRIIQFSPYSSRIPLVLVR